MACIRLYSLYIVCNERTTCQLFTVRQLHREFLRSGSDVIQAFTFYASEDKLENRGNDAAQTIGVSNPNIIHHVISIKFIMLLNLALGA